jgi:carbon-monoxide dehydrogenase medium subunit
MHLSDAGTTLRRAHTLDDAVALLAEPDARPLAGATWLMRSPLRREPPPGRLVDVTPVPELRAWACRDGVTTIGAAVTHRELAGALGTEPAARWHRGLASAAARSANPAVREVATVGGNLCAVGFAAADLVPALLAADAEVVVRAPDARRTTIAQFLADPARGRPGLLVEAVRIPHHYPMSAHVRLPLRAAGDYPAVIVSVAARLQEDGRVDRIRIALGAVAAVAFGWTDLEDVLCGEPLSAEFAYAAAADLRAGLPARDGLDAGAWYRREVTPALVRRAVALLTAPPLETT